MGDPRAPPMSSVGPLNLGTGGRSGLWGRFGVNSLSTRISSLSFFANYRDSGGFEAPERPPIGEGGLPSRYAPSVPPRSRLDAFNAVEPSGPGPDGQSERFSNVFKRAHRLSAMINSAFRKNGMTPSTANPANMNPNDQRGDVGPKMIVRRAGPGAYPNGANGGDQIVMAGGRQQQGGQGGLYPAATDLGPFATVYDAESNRNSMAKTARQTEDERQYRSNSSGAPYACIAATLFLIAAVLLIILLVRRGDELVVRGLNQQEGEALAPNFIDFDDGIIDGKIAILVKNSGNEDVPIEQIRGQVKLGINANAVVIGEVTLINAGQNAVADVETLFELQLNTDFPNGVDPVQVSQTGISACQANGVVTFTLDLEIQVGVGEPEPIDTVLTRCGCDLDRRR